MNRKVTIEELLSLINEEYVIFGKSKDKFIVDAKPILDAVESSLSFIHKTRTDKQQLLERSNAGVIICDKEAVDLGYKDDVCYITVNNPKEVFANVVNAIYAQEKQYGIHPSAIIHPKAVIHKNSFIGPNTYIGESVIGENSFIQGNTYIYDKVTIGKNVIINAGCSIGAPGFGYLKNESGQSFNFPHIGGVVIEDKAEIGCNTCIDRGALGNTTIKEGAKIDNLVHIAHNVVVGKNAWIIANAMIGGSTIIEDNAYIAPSVSLRDVITIGANAMVGMGSVVTKHVPPGQIWTGNPSKELKQFIELQDKLKKL